MKLLLKLYHLCTKHNRVLKVCWAQNSSGCTIFYKETNRISKQLHNNRVQTKTGGNTFVLGNQPLSLLLKFNIKVFWSQQGQSSTNKMFFIPQVENSFYLFVYLCVCCSAGSRRPAGLRRAEGEVMRVHAGSLPHVWRTLTAEGTHAQVVSEPLRSLSESWYEGLRKAKMMSRGGIKQKTK